MVKKLGVVGSGIMGRGIAHAFFQSGTHNEISRGCVRT